MSHMTFTSRAIERLALATNTSAIRSACDPGGGRYTPDYWSKMSTGMCSAIRLQNLLNVVQTVQTLRGYNHLLAVWARFCNLMLSAANGLKLGTSLFIICLSRKAFHVWNTIVQGAHPRPTKPHTPRSVVRVCWSIIEPFQGTVDWL